MKKFLQQAQVKLAATWSHFHKEILPGLFREDLRKPQLWVFMAFAVALAVFCNAEGLWDFDSAKFNSWDKALFRIFKTSYVPCLFKEIMLLGGIYGATLLIPQKKYRCILWSVLISYLTVFAIGNSYMVFRYCCPAKDMPVIINSTDLQEVREYFMSLLMNNKLFLFSAFAGVLLLPTAMICALYKTKSTEHPRRTGIFLVIIAALAMFIPPDYSGFTFWRNLSAVDFLYCLNETDFHLASADNAVHHPNLPANIAGSLKNSPPVLGVVIIGESDNRHNHTLYGYEKNTEPQMVKLSKDPGFVRFKDALSPTPSTQHSLYFMFTDARINDMEKPAGFAICELLHSAGAKVHFLSNQRAHGAWCSMAALLFAKAEELLFFTDGTQNTFDRIALLPHVNERLSKFSASLTDPTVMFVHLMGSHYEQVYRVDPQWKSDNQQLLAGLDEYDQSVAYTDSFLGEAAAKVAAAKQPAFMIYIPDHSETVPTNRSLTTPDDVYYEIPFYVFCNDAYRKTFPELFAALRTAAEKPVQTDIIIYLIARLMNIPAQAIPQEADILGSKFLFTPRLTGFGEKVYGKDAK